MLLRYPSGDGKYVVAYMSLQLRDEADVIYMHMACKVIKFSESRRSLAHEVREGRSGPRAKPQHSITAMQPEKEMEEEQSTRPKDSRRGWCPWTISKE